MGARSKKFCYSLPLVSHCGVKAHLINFQTKLLEIQIRILCVCVCVCVCVCARARARVCVRFTSIIFYHRLAVFLPYNLLEEISPNLEELNGNT